MSEIGAILKEQAERLIDHHWDLRRAATTDDGIWPDALWRALEDAALLDVLVPEGRGGPGAGLPDAVAVMKVAGSRGAPVPVAETAVARAVLAACEIELPHRQPLALAFTGGVEADARSPQGWMRVKWPDRTAGVVEIHDGLVAYHPRSRWHIEQTFNDVAGEPNAWITATGGRVPASRSAEAMPALATLALLKAAQMAGAMLGIVDIVVRYAGERVQFGRPIGSFQAVQNLIAETAAHACAASAAVDAAAGSSAQVQAWSAKARASQAAGRVTANAHQVAGAIGYTREFHLHPLTRHLWAWRDEAGDEDYWHARIGAHALANGARTDFWSYLTEFGRQA